MASPPRTHEDLSRHIEIKGGSDRSFGLVFAGFFTLVAAISAWRHGWMWPWALPAAGVFAGLALVAPTLLAPLNRGWTRFGVLLSRIMNPIVLGLMFFVTILPIGLLLRAMGKDLLRLKRDPAAASYWIDRTPPGPAPETMRNQF